MKRNRQTNTAKFLRSFGLKPTRNDSFYTDQNFNEVQNAGIDPTDVSRFGTFSPQAGDVYYATERLARKYLSWDFDRVERIMLHMAEFLEEHPNIKRVADLGGREGMISLYLASRFPDCQFTVYDHAPRPLKQGEDWAAKKSISNIAFEHASYQEVAKRTDSTNHDLVLFSHGMDLWLPDPRDGVCSMDICPCKGFIPSPSNSMLSAIEAIHQLLRDDGLAVVTGGFSAWGLIRLCEAYRLTGLGIDWRLCYAHARKSITYVEKYLALRKGLPHLTASSYEDAQAFLNLQPIVDGVPLTLERMGKRACSSPPESLVVDGTGVSKSGERQRVRLWMHDGTWIVSIDGLNGDSCCLRGDLSQLGAILDEIEDRLIDWQSDGREVESWYVDPTLAAFLEFQNQNLQKPLTGTATRQG